MLKNFGENNVPETRIVLRNCEKIDPRDLKAYLAVDGFKAWKRCQEGLSPGGSDRGNQIFRAPGPGRGRVQLRFEMGTGPEAPRGEKDT